MALGRHSLLAFEKHLVQWHNSAGILPKATGINNCDISKHEYNLLTIYSYIFLGLLLLKELMRAVKILLTTYLMQLKVSIGIYHPESYLGIECCKKFYENPMKI